MAASKFGLGDRVHYRTNVYKVEKKGNKWALSTGTLAPIRHESVNEQN